MQTETSTTMNLGFLTVLHEADGYLGGYLVTNSWGRPLEFRVSTVVQPNRVQRILYGGTLQSFICADLIGKTLIEKASTAVELIITDKEPILDLRRSVEVPVACLSGAVNDRAEPASGGQMANSRHERVQCDRGFPQDVEAVRKILDRLDGNLDLAEPFSRINDAIAEARKMGATAR